MLLHNTILMMNIICSNMELAYAESYFHLSFEI